MLKHLEQHHNCTLPSAHLCAGSVGLNVSGNVLHPSHRKRTRRGIHDG
jgi:hypothetical protein